MNERTAKHLKKYATKASDTYGELKKKWNLLNCIERRKFRREILKTITKPAKVAKKGKKKKTK